MTTLRPEASPVPAEDEVKENTILKKENIGPVMEKQDSIEAPVVSTDDAKVVKNEDQQPEIQE